MADTESFLAIAEVVGVAGVERGWGGGGGGGMDRAMI